MSSKTPDINGKPLLVALFECCMQVFIFPNMAFMAVNDNLSTKGHLIRVEHDTEEAKSSAAQHWKNH
jgi:hypothetical protein